MVFLLITLGAILSGMGQYWFGQTLIIRWREWMTNRYVDLWMAEGRHYRIRFVDQSVDNIHLRIANDVLMFIRLTHELGTGFLNAIVSLLSFAFVLWGLSALAPLPLFGVDLSFPGYLIVLAIGYAALGTLIAHAIGKPLIPLQFRQQRYESDFRFAIARVTDHAESVALMGGEKVERHELKRRYRRAAAQLGRAGAPAERTERIHLRLLPRLDGVPGAGGDAGLSRRRDPARRADAGVAGVPAGRGGVRLLRHVLCQDRGMEGGDGPRGAVRDRDGHRRRAGTAGRRHPHRAAMPVAGLSVADLVVKAARRRADRVGRQPRARAGRARAGARAVGLRQVEPLPRAGRNLAGRGGADPTCRRMRALLALPQRPYFPLGTLRQALTYPTPAEEVDDADVRTALAAAGLGHLADRLDEEAEWNTLLSGGEQQRVGFARALIHRPDVLLLDEAVSTLEDAEARDLYALLSERLPRTMVISIGRAAALVALHQRIVDMTGGSAASRVAAFRDAWHRCPLNRYTRSTPPEDCRC